MSLDPKTWRAAAKLTLAEVAARCGIAGKNPAMTYSRYERGIQRAPESIIEAVSRLSEGTVTAESWHRLRVSATSPSPAGEAAP